MVFGRSRKASPESQEALKAASPTARSAVMGSKRAVGMWRRLIKKVGVRQAIEHLEVSVLVGMIEAQEAGVSESMQTWRSGMAADATVLQGLAAVEEDFKPRLEQSIRHLRQASTRPESLAVSDTGRRFINGHFDIARHYITGSMTEEEGHVGMAAKQAWIEALDHWDAATGRPRLPLVGG
jgi:hypothetical protein